MYKAFIWVCGAFGEAAVYTTRGRSASEFPALFRGDLRSGTPLSTACTALFILLMLFVSHTS